jgi:hypothetical protein
MSYSQVLVLEQSADLRPAHKSGALLGADALRGRGGNRGHRWRERYGKLRSRRSCGPVVRTLRLSLSTGKQSGRNRRAKRLRWPLAGAA